MSGWMDLWVHRHMHVWVGMDMGAWVHVYAFNNFL